MDLNTSPNSPSSPVPSFVRAECDLKNESKQKSGVMSRSSRKGKVLLDICSLPEGAPVESLNMSTRGKPPPSPLNLTSRQVCTSYKSWFLDLSIITFRIRVMQNRMIIQIVRFFHRRHLSGPSINHLVENHLRQLIHRHLIVLFNNWNFLQNLVSATFSYVLSKQAYRSDLQILKMSKLRRWSSSNIHDLHDLLHLD